MNPDLAAWTAAHPIGSGLLLVAALVGVASLLLAFAQLGSGLSFVSRRTANQETPEKPSRAEGCGDSAHLTPTLSGPSTKGFSKTVRPCVNRRRAS